MTRHKQAMAKEISLNNSYNSIDEFKAAVKAALLIIPEGIIRIHTWYNRAEGDIPHTNITVQKKLGSICIGGIKINRLDHTNVNDHSEEWVREAISELISSGIHVYPRIRTSWEA